MARGRRGGGRKRNSKPPVKEDMAAKVPKKLSDDEVAERQRRFILVYGKRQAIVRARRSAMRDWNGQLKDIDNELDLLHEQCIHGVEMLPQGDLFVQEGGNDVAQPVAASALAEVGRLAESESAEPPETQH